MIVWVITGRTESGDNIGPYVLDYKPTSLEMHEIVKKDMPEEYKHWETGEDLEPGEYDSDAYAYPELNYTTLIKRK